MQSRKEETDRVDEDRVGGWAITRKSIQEKRHETEDGCEEKVTEMGKKNMWREGVGQKNGRDKRWKNNGTDEEMEK